MCISIQPVFQHLGIFPKQSSFPAVAVALGRDAQIYNHNHEDVVREVLSWPDDHRHCSSESQSGFHQILG